MPRSARLVIPGMIHHVICRGIERREIFTDEKDYKEFLRRLSALAGKETVVIYAFCLMSNHVHLLVRPLELSLSALMRRLLTGFAVYFNRRHRRSGHLFQNRYKSFVVEEDVYFLELIRYIHLNPVRASIIPDIAKLSFYPYTGHAALMGKVKYPFYEAEQVLLHFGRRVGKAQESLVDFMQEGISKGRQDNLVGGGLRRSLAKLDPAERRHRQAYDERILGSGNFVETVLTQLEEGGGKTSDLSIEVLLEDVASYFDITVAELCSGSKRAAIARARAAVVYLATREVGIAPTQLAAILSIGSSAVCMILKRGTGETEGRRIMAQQRILRM